MDLETQKALAFSYVTTRFSLPYLLDAYQIDVEDFIQIMQKCTEERWFETDGWYK